MSTTPAVPSESFLEKVWNWIKGKAVLVESDLAEVIGSGPAQELEKVAKAALDSWIGPLATAAIADATDVATGTMTVSKAVSSLVSAAGATGKTVSAAAALQTIALVQNALPTAPSTTATTVTPN